MISETGERNPTVIDYLCSIVFVVIAACAFLNYALLAFAAITSRHGVLGDMHIYYNLSRGSYSAYNLILAAIAATVIVWQIIALIRGSRWLRNAYWRFLGFMLFAAGVELLMQLRFTGKR